MLIPTLKKYNSTTHSSTGMTPTEAHKDTNRIYVKANLTLKQKHMRKYPAISANDEVKVYTKGKGNYTSRKAHISRWSERKYKVETIERDMTLQKVLCIRRIKPTLFKTRITFSK